MVVFRCLLGSDGTKTERGGFRLAVTSIGSVDTYWMVDVTLNLASGLDEPILVLVKLQSPTWEFNFRTTPEELAGLSSIRHADWATKRCLHIGESAGAPVHWSAAEQTATIMVGHDDETWDIAVTVPITTVDTIVTDAAAGSW